MCYQSAGPWARRVLGDWFVCYPSSSFVFSLIVPTARIFDKSNFPPPSPQPKGPAEQSAGVNIGSEPHIARLSPTISATKRGCCGRLGLFHGQMAS